MQKANGIPAEMQRQVIGYYEYLWFRKKGVTDDGLMNDLPITFHAEVAQEANKHILDKVSCRMMSSRVNNELGTT